MAPSTPSDAKGLLKTAIRNDNPVIFLESELDYNKKGEVPEGVDHLVPIGKAAIVTEGRDLTLISYGRMMTACAAAIQSVARESISIELIDLRTIKPLDLSTLIQSVKKTHRCLIVEEGHSFAGIAAEITFQLSTCCFDDLDAPILRVCQRETPMPYSKVLEAATLPNPDRIIAAIHTILR